MRFILVNLRYEEKDEVCAICCTPLGKSYVRDLQTRIVYHSAWCLERHVEISQKCIEDAARMVT